MPHLLKALGIDDGYFPPYFKGGKGKTVIVAVLMEGSKLIDAELALIDVDGVDATGKAINLTNKISSKNTPDIIFLDGVTYAGFNFIDPYKLYEETHVPIAVIFRYPLKLNNIYEALRKNFKDYILRYKIIEKTYVSSLPLTTFKGTIQVTPIGIEYKELHKVITNYQLVSVTPEPLRIADIIASGISITTYKAHENKVMLRGKGK